jgi:hypothetical protein
MQNDHASDEYNVANITFCKDYVIKFTRHPFFWPPYLIHVK